MLMSFIVALFTDTSTELMSGAKSREWVHHNSTNQPFAWSQHGGSQMRISDIAHFAHSKNLDNMMDKLQKLPD